MAIVSAVDAQKWEKIAEFAVEEGKIRNEKVYFLHRIEVPKLGSMMTEKIVEEEMEKIGKEILIKCEEIAREGAVNNSLCEVRWTPLFYLKPHWNWCQMR